METILLIIHVLVALALIGLVLIQQGKGADMGAGFGSGASGTVFGASGSASFMSRLTGGVAAAFFILTIILAIVSSKTAEHKNEVDAALSEPKVEKTIEADPDAAPVVPGEESAEEDDGAAVPAAPEEGAKEEAASEELKPEAEQFEEKAEVAAEEAKVEVKQIAVDTAEKVEEASKEAAEEKPAQ